MQSRMAHLAEEKLNIEQKVNLACIQIQSLVRMRIQRKKYLNMKEY